MKMFFFLLKQVSFGFPDFNILASSCLNMIHIFVESVHEQDNTTYRWSIKRAVILKLESEKNVTNKKCIFWSVLIFAK